MTPNHAARVLIADDDQIATRVLRLLLGADGHEVTAVASGDDAWKEAGRLRPDLVLLDVEMPGMSGFDVCRRLRADPTLGEVPIVLITALSDQAARLKGIEAGADDFISKPFDRAELAARVRTITRLNRYRRLQEGQQLAQQIEMAAAIQEQLLPHSAPCVPGLELSSRYRPAALVGGDFFDFVDLHPGLFFAIADVAGHGLASALFMSNARSVLRALRPWTLGLTELADHLNSRITEDAGDSGMFVSAVIGEYRPASRTIDLVNCGHPEPVLLRADGRVVTVGASASPIGLTNVLGAETFTAVLEPGDMLCLFTDGIIEASDKAGHAFGADGITHVLREHRNAPLDAIANAILAAVNDFHGAPPADDVTLVLLRHKEVE